MPALHSTAPRRRPAVSTPARLAATSPRKRRGRAVGVLSVLAFAAVAASAPSTALATGTCSEPRFVGSWGASPSDWGSSMTNRTMRVIVKAHRPGERVQVRLTNRWGTEPLTIKQVTISQVVRDPATGDSTGPKIVKSTTRDVEFSAQPGVSIDTNGVTIAPGVAGADVKSDPLTFTVPDPYIDRGEKENDESDDKPAEYPSIAIDVHFSGTVARPTRHKTALQTSYSTKDGVGGRTGAWNDVDASGTNPFGETQDSWYFVRGLDVEAPGDHGTVVALGDSLSDGTGSAPNADQRYPDWLQRKLATVNPKLSVVNAGIGGNMVLQDGLLPYAGQSMRGRLLADVVAQPGVTDVLVLGGANDMGQPNASLTPSRFPRASDVIHGYGDLFEALHARGINVIAVTIPPTGGAWVATYGDFWMGDDRRAVNTWIRDEDHRHVPGVASTTRYPDGFWDLSKAVQDAKDVRQLPGLVTWDNVHPNGAGYKKFIDDTATAAVNNLSLLRGAVCS